MDYINLMSSQIHYYENVLVDKIKIGKHQLFGDDFYLMPIYYNPEKKKGYDNDSLIIKTPRLFVPHNIKKINERYFIEVSFININEDPSVLKFKQLIRQIEKTICKLIIRRKKLKCTEKLFVSILKDDNYYHCKKLLLPLNLFMSECFDINNRAIKGWEFTAPTYGFFIILVKNIWIKDNKWGINLFTHGSLILPSQLVDPPPFMGINFLFEDERRLYKTIGEDTEYSKYFKMKKVKIPLPAIKQKMELESLNPDILNYDETTLIVNIPELSVNRKHSNIETDDYRDENTNGDLLEAKNKYGLSLPNIPEFQEPPSVSFGSPLSRISKNDLLTQSMRLKKTSKTNRNMPKRRQTIPANYKDMNVPSLEQIQNALNKIKSNSSTKN